MKYVRLGGFSEHIHYDPSSVHGIGLISEAVIDI